MPYVYARKYNYKGIETLQTNVLRILERDMPAELALIATETGSTQLATPAEYLKAHKPNPTLPVIVVEPDEEDNVESEDGSGINEQNILDITIVGEQSEDSAQLAVNIMRRKRAVTNILWSAKESDLLLGITHTPALWDIRGGRYAWGRANNIYEWSVRNLKLVANYSEVVNV